VNESWKDFQIDNETLVTTRIFSVGAVAWTATPFILNGLKQWHATLKPKEQRKYRMMMLRLVGSTFVSFFLTFFSSLHFETYLMILGGAVIRVLHKISQNKAFPQLISNDKSLAIVRLATLFFIIIFFLVLTL
jgi:hypothetical protein